MLEMAGSHFQEVKSREESFSKTLYFNAELTVFFSGIWNISKIFFSIFQGHHLHILIHFLG